MSIAANSIGGGAGSGSTAVSSSGSPPVRPAVRAAVRAAVRPADPARFWAAAAVLRTRYDRAITGDDFFAPFSPFLTSLAVGISSPPGGNGGPTGGSGIASAGRSGRTGTGSGTAAAPGGRNAQFIEITLLLPIIARYPARRAKCHRHPTFVVPPLGGILVEGRLKAELRTTLQLCPQAA